MLDHTHLHLASAIFPDLYQVVCLLAAVVLGGLVGLERELRDKPAGFRTIVLICVGACVFTLVSQAIGWKEQDSSRIAAQIVSGIGFLGAGAILREGGNVTGLTTAATIWAVAAIGMACGFGELGLAGAGTGVILVTLMLFNRVEHAIGEHRDVQEFRFATDKTDDALDRVDALFRDAGLTIHKRSFYEDQGRLVFDLRALGPRAGHERLRMILAKSDLYTLREL